MTSSIYGTYSDLIFLLYSDKGPESKIYWYCVSYPGVCHLVM